MIITSSSGYRLELTADQVDVDQFGAQLRVGIAAAREGDWPRAASLLDEAIALWRGRPLADIPCQELQLTEVPRLEEQRVQAVQWRIEAGLQLGQQDSVIPQLQALTTEFPLREHFHGQLMLALHRSGRQADALAAYRAVRDVLVTELGVEPGPELRLLQQRILAGDRELLFAARDDARLLTDRDLASAPPRAAQVQSQSQRPVLPVPRQLPALVAAFTGPDLAREAYAQALTLAGQLRERLEQARASDGLGWAYHAENYHDLARHYWRAALKVYAELGVSEAEQLRRRLADQL